ncbi:phosphoglycolate phosphatase [Halopseudomonas laoshanensis]|uniref:Phosphoglycolate phosphatase n=1 Tax=Halopseudomonas laoshanensis TaxID=2268758 RepID=A0A7V7KY13_9GAMM|nr:phosphoglycolate phosphatase [Halopseudomonas laoshanensis]KAA0695221.1 phosphoglycolate phosphatase [Halopseudomonas laoshanensis]
MLEQLFGGRLPKLVIFDLDGTLLDSVPDLASAIDSMLLDLGRPAAGIERVRDWVGNGSAVLVRRALAGSIEYASVDEQEAELAHQVFLQAYSGGHALTGVYPGVMAFLDALKTRGIAMAVATNKPERFVAPLLEEKGMLGYFDWLVGGDTLPVQKPDPAALHWIMQKAGVAVADTLFIGDSRNDVLAGQAAGVKVVAVSYGYNHGRPVSLENPDLLVDSLDVLI